MMHHKLALRRMLPGGVHWTMSNQTAQAKMKKGSLRKKRNCDVRAGGTR